MILLIEILILVPKLGAENSKFTEVGRQRNWREFQKNKNTHVYQELKFVTTL